MKPASAVRDVDVALSGLAARFELDETVLGRLGTLLNALCEDPLAPTAVRAPMRVVDDHLADALVALELGGVRDTSAFADIGSGAGLPGLVLAAALPAASGSLVESNGRKCEFISGAAQACGLTNVTVVNARAEAWPDGLGAVDLVTARAVAPLAVVAEYGAPLLRTGGRLIVWRGRLDATETNAGAHAARELGLEMLPARRVHPYPRAQHRHLQPFVKITATPSRFPRRPGVARKRPLGMSSTRPSDR